ncbi:hypothetical protein [Pantanalinema sp. GBBB05]|uniref:hypothetical protein n=1 Tax=Pantanalinema sp. GBBB05 TaxID=2604139 RepID=UPI001D6C1E2C|nr:hypothetical protein [Pantanalinema sp. GBBB05]
MSNSRLTYQASEAYKQRLAGWITEEMKTPESSSYAKLATVLNARLGRHAFAAQELQRWHKGKLTRTITDPKLSDIGMARGLSSEPLQAVAEAKAWLEGQSKEPGESQSSTENEPCYSLETLLKQIKSAPLTVLPAIQRAIADRVESLAHQSNSSQSDMCQLSEIIRSEIANQGMNPDDPQDVQRFLMTGEGLLNTTERAELIIALIRGEPVEIDRSTIAAISATLYLFSGNDRYTTEWLLEQMQRTPSHSDQGCMSHCEH